MLHQASTFVAYTTHNILPFLKGSAACSVAHSSCFYDSTRPCNMKGVNLFFMNVHVLLSLKVLYMYVHVHQYVHPFYTYNNIM